MILQFSISNSFFFPEWLATLYYLSDKRGPPLLIIYLIKGDHLYYFSWKGDRLSLLTQTVQFYSFPEDFSSLFPYLLQFCTSSYSTNLWINITSQENVALFNFVSTNRDVSPWIVEINLLLGWLPFVPRLSAMCIQFLKYYFIKKYIKIFYFKLIFLCIFK
jgi:hypothetical protein